MRVRVAIGLYGIVMLLKLSRYIRLGAATLAKCFILAVGGNSFHVVCTGFSSIRLSL